MDANGGTPAGIPEALQAVETPATPQTAAQVTPGAVEMTPGRPSILKKPTAFKMPSADLNSKPNAATETQTEAPVTPGITPEGPPAKQAPAKSG